jgi:GTPase Era involved in 16S rRNA processing
MTNAPLLRTLVPALRGLERELGDWLAEPNRRVSIAPIVRANLEGLRDDLRRRADDLDLEQPLLAIVLMGGTGVGKSTLLNALAGSPIAPASFTRPTTRDPVVYHHVSVKPERLDPALRKCRLVAHDREDLREKLLIDTPDLDSNEEHNRERLMEVLPVADVVLYVGSQEKYHDRLGWELFRAQRQRRAFAFVLNKWDRCSRPIDGGVRPDDDLLRDLREEGFADPLLFRTSAQHWADKVANSPPDGEQFPQLQQWLEDGLARLEIEALKARGVEQMLEHLQEGLERAKPPDLGAAAKKTESNWEQMIDAEAANMSDMLLHALEPQQREIEHHFRLTGQQRFQRLMAGYLGLVTRLQYLGSKLHRPLAVSPSGRSARPWDIDGLTRDALSAAGRRGLDARIQSLSDRLLVAADGEGFASDLLAPRLKELTALDWRGQLGGAVSDALGTVEREWVNPRGGHRLLRGGLVLLANIIPELTFVGSVVMMLWNWFMIKDYQLTLGSVLVPFVLTLAVLMVFHVLIHLLLPLRWPAIRAAFQSRLEDTTRERLAAAFLPAPAAVATELAAERKRVENLAGQVRELTELLEARRQTARIDSLYGTSKAGD